MTRRWPRYGYRSNMIVGIVVSTGLAGLIIGFVVPQPATTSPSPTPLREVVYKFSYDESEDSYLRFVDGSTSHIKDSIDSYSGSATVDVTSVGEDGSIRVTTSETFEPKSNMTATADDIVVHPDGSLQIVRGPADQEMITLLPYFASKYFGSHDLQQGNTWQTGSTVDKDKSTTTDSVVAVSGDTATITIQTTDSGVLNENFIIQSTVDYNAPLLVPTALDTVVTTIGRGTAVHAMHYHFHFIRISDTHDK